MNEAKPASGCTRPSDCSQQAIFSGENSRELWRKINNGRGNLHDLMYELGCKMQELENRVFCLENSLLDRNDPSNTEGKS